MPNTSAKPDPAPQRRAIPYQPPSVAKKNAVPYIPPPPPAPKAAPLVANRLPMPHHPRPQKSNMGWVMGLVGVLGVLMLGMGALAVVTTTREGGIFNPLPTSTPTPTPDPVTVVFPMIGADSPLYEEASRLMNSPLSVRVFDPVTGDSVYWEAMPSEWGKWVSVAQSPDSPLGYAFWADDAPLHDFLTQRAQSNLDATRTLNFDEGVLSLQNALTKGDLTGAWVQVRHQERVHTVQAGESLTSIAWDYGVPYLYIQNLNGGQTTFGIGQQVLIPPADLFLTLPVVPNKRIEISISQQVTRVYEDGQLLYEWASSTGISDSPTWTGVYQVMFRELNAYASNWNLYMPYFIGVYQPVPNADFTNGFHGFPTRGGGQLLWENSLGRRVTYGCILLNTQNIQWLYEWADVGVVVRIIA